MYFYLVRLDLWMLSVKKQKSKYSEFGRKDPNIRRSEHAANMSVKPQSKVVIYMTGSEIPCLFAKRVRWETPKQNTARVADVRYREPGERSTATR